MNAVGQNISLTQGQPLVPRRVQRPLGRGAMAEVCFAERLSVQKPVALRVLPPDLVSKTNVERFLGQLQQP